MHTSSVSTRTVVKILAITTVFVAVLGLIWMVRHQLIWIGAAFFLAVALNPAVDALSRHMPRRRRGFAITVVAVLFGIIVTFLLMSFVPPLLNQTESLANNLPAYTDQMLNGHNIVADQMQHYHLAERVRESQSELTKYLTSASGSVVGVLRSFFTGLAAVVTVIVLAVFMMLEGPRWLETFWNAYPVKKREHAHHLADEMYKAVAGFVTGNLLTSLIAGVATAVILGILGVPYAIPLGLVVALVDLIPLVGATIGAVIVTIVAFFTSPLAGIVTLAFFVVYQQIENHVLQPLIYGKTVEISPLTVLIAIILGAAMAGILGALVAIPIAASLQILIRDYASRRAAGK